MCITSTVGYCFAHSLLFLQIPGSVVCRTADSVYVGPAGVLALPPCITRPTLEAMLSEARDFVAEWLEMRPVFQHRLFGQCLRPPLQVHLIQGPNGSDHVLVPTLESQLLGLASLVQRYLCRCSISSLVMFSAPH